MDTQSDVTGEACPVADTRPQCWKRGQRWALYIALLSLLATPIRAHAEAPPPVAHTGVALERELPPEAAPKAKPKRGKGLLIAGIGTFVGSYLFSVLVGARIEALRREAEQEEDCPHCKIGPRFYIPAIGPWLALPDAAPGGGHAVCAIMGIAQATGLILSATGMGLMIRTRTPASRTNYGSLARLDVTAGAVPSGAMFTLRLVN